MKSEAKEINTTAERTAIPAELRRRILVEAGHRCAIHTCKHPEVEVHHIVPWEQCLTHEFENLIALCPNCHSRADTGEIDRLSLRAYKARLSASFGLPRISVEESSKAPNGIGATATPAWKTDIIRECYEPHPSYDVRLEIPVFNGIDQDTVDLNLLLRSDALRRLIEMRANNLSLWRGREERHSGFPSQMAASYEVACFTDKLISIRHSIFHYGAGAAHPNHWTEVTNVSLRPLTPLTFADLFRRDSGFVKFVSEYCIRFLTAQKGVDVPSAWILKGAGPDEKNFWKFNITPRGLFITFDEYRVDCYAAGASHVLIAPHTLSEYLNPDGPASAIWIQSRAA